MEDCCEAMKPYQNYNSFSSDDELHITTGASTSILEIAKFTNVIQKNKS